MYLCDKRAPVSPHAARPTHNQLIAAILVCWLTWWPLGARMVSDFAIGTGVYGLVLVERRDWTLLLLLQLLLVFVVVHAVYRLASILLVV